MRVIVLVKHAASTEAEIRIGTDGKSLDTRGLEFEINDWDRYAVEEALRIKEAHGGEVVVVGVGIDCDPTLRKCLAMGADRAIKVPIDTGMDPYLTAKAIKEAIKGEKFDLILAGVMSQDLNYSLVGVLLAAMLDLPFATAVTSVKIEDGKVRVLRELEGGYQEEDVLPLPCLLTVQSGINEPRYVSIMGIKRARTKELREVKVTLGEPTLVVERIYHPPIKKAEMLEGDAPKIVDQLIEILKSRGLI
ncbi:MAG: electron transfer flavoprotein subunit beta/FixA family protein [Candidatus Baldrarchaeia archaeon]